jgi:hypothetical protein
MDLSERSMMVSFSSVFVNRSATQRSLTAPKRAAEALSARVFRSVVCARGQEPRSGHEQP